LFSLCHVAVAPLTSLNCWGFNYNALAIVVIFVVVVSFAHHDTFYKKMLRNQKKMRQLLLYGFH